MYINLNHTPLYAYTGGKAFDSAKPSIVFIHGVLNDHSVWILQSRYLANHGYNVLAIDLPGHGKSAGNCPRSVESAAQTTIDLLDALKIDKAALVGHSWGSLIALHAASLAPERISHLAMVCTAAPMKVSPALLDNAQNNPQAAISMVNTFSHSTLAPPPLRAGPRHLAVRRLPRPHAPRPGQQPARERFSPRICRLRPIFRGKYGDKDRQ